MPDVSFKDLCIDVTEGDGRPAAVANFWATALGQEVVARDDGTFHLAPPLFSDRDPETGQLKKKEYGAWVMPMFRILASLKKLRGTKLDVFGYSEERRMERRLIGDYQATIDEVLATLDQNNHAMAVQIAGIPETMRGFGHVKEKNVTAAKEREASLLAAYRTPASERVAAE